MPGWNVYLSEEDFDQLLEIARAHGYSAKSSSRTLVALLRAIAQQKLFLSEKSPVNAGPSDETRALTWLCMLAEEVNVVDLIAFLNAFLAKMRLIEAPSSDTSAE